MYADLICDVCGDSEGFKGRNFDIIVNKVEKEGWYIFQENNRYRYMSPGSYQGYCPKHKDKGTTDIVHCRKPINEPCPNDRCFEITIDAEGTNEYGCEFYISKEKIQR